LKYGDAGGRHLLEIDLAVAGEIADRITEQTEESRKSPAAQSRKARKAVEKRQRMGAKGLGELLKDTFDNKEGE
tara:strand:+ start:2992 stop:3213 length:222 start_codon:yes stop_codon:yes gene_type:complete